jgi:hypothetical protein
MLAQLAAARERAMMDGYEARLEIAPYKEADGTKRIGARFWFTNLPAKGTEMLDEENEERQRERATSRAKDREWMVSEWNPLPKGIFVSGISIEAGHWEKLPEGDHAFNVKFFADGSIERAVAVRLESEDLDVRPEHRTVTVMVNALTAEAASYEGFRELPKQRDAGEFR